MSTPRKPWEVGESNLIRSEQMTTLRPWCEVARLYTEKTGEPITRGGAWTVGQRALRKIRRAIKQGGNR